MHPATEAILHFNQGRDPERFTRKLAAIAADPFAFFRGTNHLYVASLRNEDALLDAPTTYVCGDLHLENFGSFKGDNGLVYFDLNDFDDGLVAPLTIDVVRVLSSVMVAAGQIGLSDEDARGAARQCWPSMRQSCSEASRAGSNVPRPPAWWPRCCAGSSGAGAAN